MSAVSSVQILATGAKFLHHNLQGTGPAIEDIISEAKNEIHILAYVITTRANRMLKLLNESLDRGVKVTIVVNKLDEQHKSTRTMLERMSKKHKYLNVTSFEPPNGDMHAKVIIADRNRAVIGSANFSLGGMRKNYEIGVKIEGAAAWQLSKLIDSLVD